MTALIIGILIGILMREILRLLWGIFSTPDTADDIGDAGTGDTRIMIFETTRTKETK